MRRLVLAAAIVAVLLGCSAEPQVDQGFAFEEAVAVPAPAFEEDEVFPAIQVDPAKLQAAREDWLNRGISTYSYAAVLHMDTGPASSDCDAFEGELRVQVVDGEVVSATAGNAACSIDPLGPDRPPLTGEEIYAAAIELASEFGAAEFALGEHSFPGWVFVEGPNGAMQFELLEFSFDESAATQDSGGGLAALSNAREAWQRAGVADYTIEVEQGGAVTVDHTVDELFDTIEQRLSAGDEVLVGYNPANGIPVMVEIAEEPPMTVLSFVADADIDLAEVLRAEGVDVDEAPAESIVLGDARFCGLDRTTNSPEPEGDLLARRCVRTGFEREIASVLVQSRFTVEGDPIVTVFKADAEGVTEYVDSTRDSFGSGGWQVRSCEGSSALQPSSSENLDGFDLSC